ncbi:MBL fold metallo-hydrolase [Desulfohalobium retbaense]|uniref:Beta-lactamase domain protein n=1 Tax=Desulfohalobium retbaense (strain ATCC 49708 / DSM 5692 / JCM 16813 / HR100) TaxID=485915 RepID=C8X2S0_DESRD|nr:MBL fold metallo-hydrolase [Desulfohalobium retbaense]ACV68717.1 beta-lactamase domain protein [Desulfohalobium retbaense DSM 5692]
MRLTILVDNCTCIDRYFLAEPALSIFIEDQGQRILFDCGYSDVFLHNAVRAGIDLLHLDFLAFSHGHLDHTWGLDALIRRITEARLQGLPHHPPHLVAHPRTFVSVFEPTAGDIGALLSREKVGHHFNCTFSTEPVALTERLTWLGTIPRLMPFESQDPIGSKADDERPDFLPDDTALAYRSEKGLVIITGCSHAGICNIVEYAKHLTGECRVVDIIGGLHLQSPSTAQLAGTIGYLEKEGLSHLHAGHCTDLASKIALARTLPLREVGSGLSLSY